VVWRAIRVSLVVGTVLTLVNQGRAALEFAMDRALLFRVLLNYTVPFLVSLYAMRGATPRP
jgi:hypothetical protein